MTLPHPGTCVCKSSDVSAAAPTGRSCVAAVAAERTWTPHAPAHHPNSRTLWLILYRVRRAVLVNNGQRSGRKVHFLKLPATSETHRRVIPLCVTERVEFSWSWRKKWCSRNEVAHTLFDQKKKSAAYAEKFLFALICRFYVGLFGFEIQDWKMFVRKCPASIRQQCTGWRLNDSARLHPFPAGTRVVCPGNRKFRGKDASVYFLENNNKMQILKGN